MSRNLTHTLPVWIQSAFSRCLSGLCRRSGAEASGELVQEVRGILRAGQWCGCALSGCQYRRVPVQWPVLVVVRPRLKLWACSQGTECPFQLPGAAVLALWSAERVAAGYDESPTTKSATPTTSKACGPQSEEDVARGDAR